MVLIQVGLAPTVSIKKRSDKKFTGLFWYNAYPFIRFYVSLVLFSLLFFIEVTNFINQLLTIFCISNQTLFSSVKYSHLLRHLCPFLDIHGSVFLFYLSLFLPSLERNSSSVVLTVPLKSNLSKKYEISWSIRARDVLSELLESTRN